MTSSHEDRIRDTQEDGIHAPPGTEILFDSSGPSSNLYAHLQHIEQDGRRILLVPQPSKTHPNDPLSWSALKKAVVFANACAYSFLGGCTGPIITAGILCRSKVDVVYYSTDGHAQVSSSLRNNTIRPSKRLPRR